MRIGGGPDTCEACGGAHKLLACPLVESVEFYESGATRRVVLRTPPKPPAPTFPNTYPWWQGQHHLPGVQVASTVHMKPNEVGWIKNNAGAN